MKTILLALTLAISSIAQDVHPPQPEQCRADVRYWHSYNREMNDKLSYNQIATREEELMQCMVVDTGAGEPLADFKEDVEFYELLSEGYAKVRAMRLGDFLQRHDLIQQFKDEDAAGKR